ncbi:MAG TPA: MMPL family transporter [Gemmatimonadaceae bacterium]|nr:MMPL family transporter [Gemmatimonadaceae bacterium]
MPGSGWWEEAGTTIVRRRRWLLALWAALAAALLPLARDVESRLETSARVPGSESGRVTELLAERFASPYARYAVVVLRGLPPPDDRAGRAALDTVVTVVRRHPAVAGVFSALDTPDSMFVGEGGGTFAVVGLRDGVAIDDVLPSLRAATGLLAVGLRVRHPRAEILWTGEGPLTADLRRASAADADRAERRVLPLTLALLLVAFGGVVAAAIPVAAGALAISLTLGCVALLARATPLSILVLNVTTMLGLGLGIDYALLLVSRFREARREGLGPEGAAAAAATHAGRSVVLSGAAVMVGFAALLLVPLTDLRGIAVGGLVVTAMSVLLAVTLLPGLLAMLGTRVELGRVRPRAIPGAGWRRWSTWVVRRPLLVLALAAVPVAALVSQWPRLTTRMPSGDWLPSSAESARGLRALRGMGRSGVVQAIRVVVALPPGTTALSLAGWRATGGVGERLTRDPRVARVRSLPALAGAAPSPLLLALVPAEVRATFVSRDERLALVEVMPAEGAGAGGAMELVRELRAADPAVLTGLPGARIAVGGLPAFNLDYEDAVARATPLVVGLVLAGTFVALLVGFRSVLVPLKAIALNLASVGAAFGAVVLVFQDGHAVGALGLAAPLDGVFPAVPLLVFATVFGLSMDYEVFLVARVAEARRRGAGEGAAVVEGVRRTGGVITSAALIMTVVFGAFVLGDFVLMKILGFALAVAVLLDVTVVRLALGPALLAIAGRWNWWPGVPARPARGLRRVRPTPTMQEG